MPSKLTGWKKTSHHCDWKGVKHWPTHVFFFEVFNIQGLGSALLLGPTIGKGHDLDLGVICGLLVIEAGANGQLTDYCGEKGFNEQFLKLKFSYIST